MTDADVLVVGGGLGGAMAAVAAARHRPDHDIGILTQAEMPFADETGLIGVLGTPADGGSTVVDPFEAVADLPADHPYRVLGTDALREALATFDDATSETYCGASTDANALVVTSHGEVTPVARYPAAVAPGLASRDVPTLFVGFERLPDFVAPLAATRLQAAGIPADVAGVTVSVPGNPGDGPTTLALAEILDENPEVDDLPVRERLARRVEPHVGDAERVGFPAVLGRHETTAVHAELAAHLDADVFEIPLVRPHVPGIRLGDALESALAAAGVDRIAEAAVTDARAGADGGVRLTLTGDGPEAIRAKSAVLATGGLVRGGIVAAKDAVREPLFDCHVPHPSSRVGWADRDPFGDHAFARFGVRIDGDARPLDANDDPEHEALFAAGRIVGGHDAAGEGSIAGVAITTGYVAGRQAAETVEK